MSFNSCPYKISTFNYTELWFLSKKRNNQRIIKKFPPNIQQVALRKLRMLHRAVNVVDLRIPPANRLEKLHGNRAGQWSIRVNDQWRICFDWQDGDALNVEIVDYH